VVGLGRRGEELAGKGYKWYEQDNETRDHTIVESGENGGYKLLKLS